MSKSANNLARGFMSFDRARCLADQTMFTASADAIETLFAPLLESKIFQAAGEFHTCDFDVASFHGNCVAVDPLVMLWMHLLLKRLKLWAPKLGLKCIGTKKRKSEKFE